MINPYAILAAVVIFFGSLFAAYQKGKSVENAYWEAKVLTDQVKAVNEARTLERQSQEKINAC